MATRKVIVDGKQFDGVREIILEVIKNANLEKFTYEDIILAADGNLKKYAPYLNDKTVQQSLWGMAYLKMIEKVGRDKLMGIYKLKKEHASQSVKEIPAPKLPDEISASELGEMIIRYISILKQNNNSAVARESLLNKEIKRLQDDLIITRKEISNLNEEAQLLRKNLAEYKKWVDKKATESTFKLSEIAIIK